MTRNDIHRPSEIIPSDYEFVGIAYMKTDVEVGDVEMLRVNQENIAAHRKATGGDYSNHEHGGSCHVCGAHAIYTVVFYHRPSNTYIKTGFDCADHLDYNDTQAFRQVKEGVKSARQAKAGKKKARVILTDAGIEAAIDLYEMDKSAEELVEMGLMDFHDRQGQKWNEETCQYEEVKERIYYSKFEYLTLCDIVSKLIRYGSISDKQMAFLKNLTDQCLNAQKAKEEREAKREEWKQEKAAAPDAPEGRVEFTVTVLKANSYESQWGLVEKVFCKSDEGWTCYGSLPKGCDSFSWDAPKGYRMKLRATLEQADDDTKHAFFKRPHLIEELEPVGKAKELADERASWNEESEAAVASDEINW